MSSAGAFAEWQPRYAEHNVATFPVTENKIPAVKGYLKIGLRASEQLALRFPANDAFGFACRRNRITVLDVDAPDERLLADALDQHGHTPFIVRSGSGNFQAWYRHNGEKRRVRPDPEKPIDILGDGFVVAPPSVGSNGRYEIIQGTLEDLDRLPTMRPTGGNVNHGTQISERDALGVTHKLSETNEENTSHIATRSIKRNETLWRHCMKVARGCANLEELMDAAIEYNNAEFYPPLPPDEVLKIVASAWSYELEGKNWFGLGGRVVFDVETIDIVATKNPYAVALLLVLKRHHDGQDTFYLANSTAKTFGWSVNTFKNARDRLVELGFIRCIHPGGRGPKDPPVYGWKGVRK